MNTFYPTGNTSEPAPLEKDTPMALYNEDGTELTDSAVTTLAGTGVDGPKVYVVAENVYADFTFTGTATKGRKLKFYKGQQISQSQLDAALETATDDVPAG